ncbi:DUF2637 domain-containing protein [Gordonia alkaliphila]|uniref:DUF2637 domain-containing protein n=1 Tax=Gordonia alkaliphila TaxID=1053547 RepID=A0ABP8YZ53_9ACTN
MIADTMKPVETYGRRLYASVLVFVSLLSVAGNAVYAYAAPPVTSTSLSPGWAAAAHMIPPVTLLLVTEVLAMASTKFTGRGRAWALAGVVVIAAAAFALSFDALFVVAQMAKVRVELAWLVPVMLDVAIVVCTVLVLMASRQIQRDRVAGLGSVDAPTEPVALTPNELVALTPVVRSAERPTDPGGGPTEPVVHGAAEPVARPDEFLTDRPHEPVELDSTDDLDRSSETSSTEWIDLAERVRSTTSITADTADLARVLEMDAAGASRGEIAGEVGRAKSTIGGWIKTAAEVAPERPQLTAVGD